MTLISETLAQNNIMQSLTQVDLVY